MKVYTRGEGEPEITVVGSLHGDEPAGQKAIEELIESNIDFQRPVKFIIANEKALEQDKRFLDADLNRSFPGDSESSLHEERLAAEILEEIGDTTVIDIHTTRSQAEPFAVIKHRDDEILELVEAANVEDTIYFPSRSGNIQEFITGVTVETGLQGTDKAADNAVDIVKNFLAYHDAIVEDYATSDPELFEYFETVEGEWVFEAENFEKVEVGEVYASKEDEELVAEKSFYPVLMSTNGYDGILGYKARKPS